MTDNTSALFLNATVESLNDTQMVLRLADGQAITCPRAALLGDALVGSPVRLRPTLATTDEQEREALAKTILNQLLKS